MTRHTRDMISSPASVPDLQADAEASQADEVRARLAAIVESSDDAIISKDLNGTIRTWNAGAVRLFGYSAAEAIGKHVTLLIPTERYDEEPSILERVRRGERVDHYETVRRSKDGVLLDISLTVSPIFDPTGRVVGASKIARDISERKRSERQREQLLKEAECARKDAEAANRAKDEFLAMLGHEIRNPLSAVRNGISVALLDETQRERALEIARRQTDQLTRIVDDLLDVARITRGHVSMRKERLALADVLRRAVEGARQLMEERGHALSVSVPAEAIYLEADAARIEQAIGNLLTNAAKYTDPGGAVKLSAELDGQTATIRVRDNGIGLSPELLPRVFDLFVQAESALDRTQGGLGIGLTLVHRIVALHGGSVEAKSSGAGTGAEFIIRLPAAHTAFETSAATKVRGGAPDEPTEHGSTARVLMVEDNPDAAETLAMLLERHGHHVSIAHDGLAALAAVRASVPDVVLIDIGLPGMNGYELAERLRREAGLERLVLVALTGYGLPADKERARTAGFDHHIVKPVQLDALKTVLAKLGTNVRLAAL